MKAKFVNEAIKHLGGRSEEEIDKFNQEYMRYYETLSSTQQKHQIIVSCVEGEIEKVKLLLKLAKENNTHIDYAFLIHCAELNNHDNIVRLLKDEYSQK